MPTMAMVMYLVRQTLPPSLQCGRTDAAKLPPHSAYAYAQMDGLLNHQTLRQVKFNIGCADMTLSTTHYEK